MLLCREWAMHPNGQLPAYEWAFGDVNPPVHAWAAWQVYRHRRPPGPRLPDPDLHQAAAQLLLVGQPQGRRRLEPVRGRLPRHGQHRPVRPLGPAARRLPARGVRRDELDGVLLPADAADRRRTGLGSIRRGTTSRPSSSSTSCRSPMRCGPSARRTSHSGTRRTASTTTCWCTPTARTSRCGCGRWSGCCRCSPLPQRRAGRPRRCRTSPRGCAGCSSRRPELLDGLLTRTGPDGRTSLLSLLDEDRLRRVTVPHVRRRRIPFPASGFARCRPPTATRT